MAVSNKLQRQLSRAVHLGAGVLLGVATYGPPDVTLWLQVVMQVAVVPALTLSGIWMWYGARILKRLHGR